MLQSNPPESFGLSREVIAHLVKLFEQDPKIKKAVIFGSRALGTFETGSDIDIALEGSALTLDTRLKLLVEYRKLNLPWELDLILMTAELDPDPELLEHIHQFGIAIFER